MKNRGARSFIFLSLFLFAAIFIFAVPEKVFAAPEKCAAINGFCAKSKECSSLFNGTSAGELGCTNNEICCLSGKEASTCDAFDGACTNAGACTSNDCNVIGSVVCPDDKDKKPQACCVCPTVKEKTGADCQNTQKGTCSFGCTEGKEDNLGSLDCPPAQSCCRLKIVAPAAAAGSKAVSGGTVASAGTAPGGLVLPACVKDGNCKLDDIVQTGVNFATFLLGLSGAVFFLIFIYGGATYLLSFGDSGKVKKGQDAIKGAAIGLIIVMSAWTIVKYVVGSLVPGGPSAPASGQAKTCDQLGAPWSCTTLAGKTAQAALQDAETKGLTCQPGLCPKPDNLLCCKPK
ncbi:MAG: pilin [Patescibacteria group bacterium]|nr:pilin [Patescibacteria group bacterium]